MSEYNIRYSVKNKDLLEEVKKEISKYAARLTDDKGTPLYDLIKVYSADVSLVDDFLRDAVDQFYMRFQDVARIVESYGEGFAISLYLPDIDSEMVSTAEAELNRFLTVQICAFWLSTRYEQGSKLYADRALASLSRLIEILRTRKAPQR